MKKLIGILLTLLIIGSNFGLLSMYNGVHAQAQTEWPGFDVNGDGKLDIDDAVDYIKAHCTGYNSETGAYSWDFADAQDIAMAEYFMQSVLHVEYIRDSNNHIDVFQMQTKLLQIFVQGLLLDNFDGSPAQLVDAKSIVKFMVKNYLTNREMLNKIYSEVFRVAEPVSKIVELLKNTGLTDIQIETVQVSLINYFVDEGGEWLTVLESDQVWINLRFDTATADGGKYPLLGDIAGVFNVVMTIKDFADILAEHLMDIIQVGMANIMQQVKLYEISVEYIRLAIELAAKTVTTVCGEVWQSAYVHGLLTACAALAVGGGPPGIIAAAIVGVGGVVVYVAINDIINEAVDLAEDETLGLNLALYKKLSTGVKPVYIPLYQIQVSGISTQDEDNYIPWTTGCTGEDVYVKVRNNGVRTLNLRVEPEIATIDPNTGKTGWSIDDKQSLDADNWIEKENFAPGEYDSWTFCFHVDSGSVKHNFLWLFGEEWVPGENPAMIDFRFSHDWLTKWWDLFDIIGGTKYLQTEIGYFHNNVETLITVNRGGDFERGKVATRSVDVKNLRTEKITFVPEVKLIDPLGRTHEGDAEIKVTPSEITIDPQGTSRFNIEWASTNDAPTGYYLMSVNGKDKSGNRYVDNYAFNTVFYLYELEIVFPTSTSPAKAGDPTNPNPIYAYVTGLPPLITELVFFVRIGSGGAVAQNEIVDGLPVPAGYTLKVTPPGPPLIIGEGKYELDIDAFWGDPQSHSSDIEPNAVEYTSAPSTEPIEKGLAWLRTRRYGDGSWRSNVGVTSLAALAFLNAGYGETDTAVSSAISYVLGKVQSDGSIYTSYSVYETSLAILPLVATHNKNYATIIENAKNWLVGAQQDEDFGYTPTNPQYGGWTYWSAKGDPDLSNTQFALMALDAANLPKTDPAWSKAIIFTQRCQNRPASNDQAWAHDSTQPSYNDGGFIYRPWGWSLAGGTTSYGSMTGAGIWGLLLSGVPKTDERVVAAINWVKTQYTWDNNPGIGWWRPYYYYLSMSKALTMYGEPIIDGHDWYQELYNKIVGMQIDAGAGQGYWSTSAEDYDPELTTAYAILSLQTRAVAPPVQRLSYLTFILRSNCLIRIFDSEGNLVGYNYMTGLGENQIPTAIYSGPFSEPQYIVIINPKAGTYKLELIGISEGPYILTIQGNYGEEVTDTFEYTGDIKPRELHGSEVTVTAIVGPIDIYANPPEFEEIIAPPTYYLTVTDNIGGLSAVSAQSGWKDECTWVTLTAPEYVPSEDGIGGIRYKFSYWDIDGTSQGMGVNPIDVHMDAPHTATAYYTVQYYLTVKTDPEDIATIPGEGWYDKCKEVTLTAPLESNVTVKYHFAYWTVDTTTTLEKSIQVHMDAPKTATAVYKDYLGDAKEEIEALRAYATDLYNTGKIGKKEYNHFMKDLDKVEKDIDNAIKNLDKERAGYDDKMKGFEDLRHAVMKLKHIIKDVQDWAKKGKIPAANATWIISELENIRMKLVDKAWAEALAERALALKAIEDAKAKGKDTTKAEKEIAKVDRELAKAEQKIAEGKLSQAIQHFKHAFAHSQHAIKKAYDPTWTTDYKDWIDELEEMDP
jgi:squalene-hopene/tetraprenyl-beta-curcumene cyclase